MQASTRPTVLPTSFPGSLGKTLVSAGHVPRPKFNARGGVGKVSNYKQLKLQEHSCIFTNSKVKIPSKLLLAVLLERGFITDVLINMGLFSV
jgi:hypothetical protein